MKNKLYAIFAILLALVLISPVFADVFVPSGPTSTSYGNPSEWTSPTLAAFTCSVSSAGVISKTSANPIGWDYTTAPTYNTLTGTGGPVIPMSTPEVFTSSGFSTSAIGSTTWVPFGNQVVVLGFIPQVETDIQTSPPSVELQITWNGAPDLITLSVPSSQTPGTSYPPAVYPNIAQPYPFAYPQTTANQAGWENLYVGNYAQVLAFIWGSTAAVPAWWSAVYGPAGLAQNGEWFWYAFTPNAGDFISLNNGVEETSLGQCSTPPTYSITAMFEYGTSQIWFNTVNFNVCELQMYSEVSACGTQNINQQLIITNVGITAATGLDLTTTFPTAAGLEIYPLSGSAQIVTFSSTGVETAVTSPQALSGSQVDALAYATSSTPLLLSTWGYTTLAPGQSLVISIYIAVSNTGSSFKGSIVFDSMLSATQIAPWKDPLALAWIYYNGELWNSGIGDPFVCAPSSGPTTSLWDGYVLYVSSGVVTYGTQNTIGGVSSYVPNAVLRTMLSEPPMTMTSLDPSPVPLIAGETSVTQADVALVRNMVLGLAPYQPRADTNGNGVIDVQDLNAYIQAASA